MRLVLSLCVVGACLLYYRVSLGRQIRAEHEWELGEVDAPPAAREAIADLAVVGYRQAGAYRQRVGQIVLFSVLLRRPDQLVDATVGWAIRAYRPGARPMGGVHVVLESYLRGGRQLLTARAQWYELEDTMIVQNLPRAALDRLRSAHDEGLDHLAARGLAAVAAPDDLRAEVVEHQARLVTQMKAHPWRVTGGLLRARLFRRPRCRGPISGRPDAAARIARWQAEDGRPVA